MAALAPTLIDVDTDMKIALSVPGVTVNLDNASKPQSKQNHYQDTIQEFIKQISISPSRKELVAWYRKIGTCDNPYRNTKPKPTSIRIMTFNIHNGFESLDSSSNSYFQTEKQLLYQLLVETNCDIIGLQEVTPRFITNHDLTAYMKQYGYLYSFFANASDIYGNGFYGQALFSKYPLLTNKILDLGEDSVNKEKRVASVSLVQLPNNKRLWVANAHLDVWDKTGNTRQKQIDIITKELKTYKDSPVILVGDFNALQSRDYSQEYQEWISKNRAARGQEYTNFHSLFLLRERFGDEVLDRSYAFYDDVKEKMNVVSTWSMVRTDYIWFTSGITKESAYVINCPLSDHFPIVAELVITPQLTNDSVVSEWSIEEVESFLGWANNITKTQTFESGIESSVDLYKEEEAYRNTQFSNLFGTIITRWLYSRNFSQEIRNFFTKGEFPQFDKSKHNEHASFLVKFEKSELAPFTRLSALRSFWQVFNNLGTIKLPTFKTRTVLYRGIPAPLLHPYVQTRPDGSQFVPNVISSWTPEGRIARNFATELGKGNPDPKEGHASILVAVFPIGTRYYVIHDIGEAEIIIPGGHFNVVTSKHVERQTLLEYVPGTQSFVWPASSVADIKVRTNITDAIKKQVLPDWMSRITISNQTSVQDITTHLTTTINELQDVFGDAKQYSLHHWGSIPELTTPLIKRMVTAFLTAAQKANKTFVEAIEKKLIEWFRREFSSEVYDGYKLILKPEAGALPKDLPLLYLFNSVFQVVLLGKSVEGDIPNSKDVLLQLSKRINIQVWQEVVLFQIPDLPRPADPHEANPVALKFNRSAIVYGPLYDIYPDEKTKRMVSKEEFIRAFAAERPQLYRYRDVPLSAYQFAEIMFKNIIQMKYEQELVRRGIPLPPARALAVIPPTSG